MACDIPKDIIHVELSYRCRKSFDHLGKDFKKGNTDFTLVLQPKKDEDIVFTEEFKIVIRDYQTDTNYELTSEYYTFNDVDGSIEILDNFPLIQSVGEFGIAIVCSDCNVSYEAIYCVEDSNISCDDLVLLPELVPDYISNIIEEDGVYTAYDGSNDIVASWSSGSSKNLYGDQINLDEERSQSVTSKIDELDAKLDNANEDILTNANAILDIEERVTDLENNPGGGSGIASSEELPYIVGEDTTTYEVIEALNQDLTTEETARIEADSALDVRITTLEEASGGITEETDPIFTAWKESDYITEQNAQDSNITLNANAIADNTEAIQTNANDIANLSTLIPTAQSLPVYKMASYFNDEDYLGSTLSQLIEDVLTNIEAEIGDEQSFQLMGYTITHDNFNQLVTDLISETYGLQTERGGSYQLSMLCHNPRLSYPSILMIQENQEKEIYVYRYDNFGATSGNEVHLQPAKILSSNEIGGITEETDPIFTAWLNGDYATDKTNLEDRITAEETARIEADSTLDVRITTLEETPSSSIGSSEELPYVEGGTATTYETIEGIQTRVTNLDQDIIANSLSIVDLGDNLETEESARIASDSALDARITTLEENPSGGGSDYLTEIYTDETESLTANALLEFGLPVGYDGTIRVVEDFNDWSQWTKPVEIVYYTTETNSKPSQDLGVVKVSKFTYLLDEVETEAIELIARTSGNDTLVRVIRENGTNLGAWRGVTSSADLNEFTYEQEYIELHDNWNKDGVDTYHVKRNGVKYWEWDISAYEVGAIAEEDLPENEFNEGLERLEIVNDGTENSLRVHYPVGTYNSTDNGVQIEYHFDGGEHFACNYDLLFEEGFSFGDNAQGGKLPGLTNTDRAQPEFIADGTNGWSARPMWRADNLDSDTEYDWVEYGRTTIVGYLYHMREGSEATEQYGDDVLPNRLVEEFTMEPGIWYNVYQEVKLNSSPNSYDGYVKYYIDGELWLSRYGLRFTTDMTKNVDTFYFSTFHGGDSEEFAPTVDSYAQFKNIEVYKIESSDYVADLKDETLESGMYFADANTDNKPSSDILNAMVIKGSEMLAELTINKWNDLNVRTAYLTDGEWSWNGYRQMLSSKDYNVPLYAEETIEGTTTIYDGTTSEVTIATLSEYDEGYYYGIASGLLNRSGGGSGDGQAIVRVYEDTTLLTSGTYVLSRDVEQTTTLNTAKKINLTGGDITITCEYTPTTSGAEVVTITDVVMSINGHTEEI